VATGWRTQHCNVLATVLTVIAIAAAPARAQTLEELRGLSIDQLANVDVTSVLRRPESLSETPAAIYVITSEDIRRSGAITLTEALRLAPNLEVARQDAPTYAISARGFNGVDSSNKLLVLIDGRSIYSPIQSGVFWDQIQVPLDNIDHIEVISGPGGTQWGANAMNGVINIITKNSRDTLGGLADMKAGPVDQNGFLRYGGRFGETGTYRAYGEGFGIGHTDLPGGVSANDDWHGGQGGFRADWQARSDSLMLEGDFYRNTDAFNGRQYGSDLLGRWGHDFSGGSHLDVQTSFDEQSRVVTGSSDWYSSYDLQAQHTFSLGRNTVVWGGEYRLIQDDFINNSNFFVLLPQRRTLYVGNVFAEDTIALTEALKLTAGLKLEGSTYTGLNYLPSIRLGWRVADTAFLWAAVSRSVRTPSRIDRELQAPGFVLPAVNFTTEKLIAYEIGYRGRPTPNTSLSVSLYYDQYDDLRTTNEISVNPLLFELGNDRAGAVYGIEAWGDWQALSWWRLSAGINLLHKNLHVKPGVVTTADNQSVGDDPGYQVFLRSSMDLPHNLELDIGFRAIDSLPDPAVQNYIEAHARLAWHVTPALELSIAGYNLLSPHHGETVTPPSPLQEARRSIYLGLRRTF